MAPNSHRRHCFVSSHHARDVNVVFLFAKRGMALRVYEHAALPLEKLDLPKIAAI